VMTFSIVYLVYVFRYMFRIFSIVYYI